MSYMDKVLAIPTEPGKVYEVIILHDDDCPIVPCTCDPEVSQRLVSE